jgi:hypothetical protein
LEGIDRGAAPDRAKQRPGALTSPARSRSRLAELRDQIESRLLDELVDIENEIAADRGGPDA